MRKLYFFLKAAFIFARHQAWVDAPAWTPVDAASLSTFLGSQTGTRLRTFLANTVVMQQAHAVTTTSNLVYEAGYCAGQRALAAAISAHADKDNFTEQGDSEGDPATN